MIMVGKNKRRCRYKYQKEKEWDDKDGRVWGNIWWKSLEEQVYLYYLKVGTDTKNILARRGKTLRTWF